MTRRRGNRHAIQIAIFSFMALSSDLVGAFDAALHAGESAGVKPMLSLTSIPVSNSLSGHLR